MAVPFLFQKLSSPYKIPSKDASSFWEKGLQVSHVQSTNDAKSHMNEEPLSHSSGGQQPPITTRRGDMHSND